jgi:hypothetical protein
LQQARNREKEVRVLERQAFFFDIAELFLEISIVLCSISLLVVSKVYWKTSFSTSAMGVLISLYAYFLPHLPSWLLLH